MENKNAFSRYYKEQREKGLQTKENQLPPLASHFPTSTIDHLQSQPPTALNHQSSYGPGIQHNSSSLDRLFYSPNSSNTHRDRFQHSYQPPTLFNPGRSSPHHFPFQNIHRPLYTQDADQSLQTDSNRNAQQILQLEPAHEPIHFPFQKRRQEEQQKKNQSQTHHKLARIPSSSFDSNESSSTTKSTASASSSSSERSNSFSLPPLGTAILPGIIADLSKTSTAATNSPQRADFLDRLQELCKQRLEEEQSAKSKSEDNEGNLSLSRESQTSDTVESTSSDQVHFPFRKRYRDQHSQGESKHVNTGRNPQKIIETLSHTPPPPPPPPTQPPSYNRSSDGPMSPSSHHHPHQQQQQQQQQSPSVKVNQRKPTTRANYSGFSMGTLPHQYFFYGRGSIVDSALPSPGMSIYPWLAERNFNHSSGNILSNQQQHQQNPYYPSNTTTTATTTTTKSPNIKSEDSIRNFNEKSVTSNYFCLAEQPHHEQRKSYVRENRYILPNPLKIQPKAEYVAWLHKNMIKGVVTVSLVDIKGNDLADNGKNYRKKESEKTEVIETVTGFLHDFLDPNDISAEFILKVLINSGSEQFRLRFMVALMMKDGTAYEESVLSDPFVVQANKSFAKKMSSNDIMMGKKTVTTIQSIHPRTGCSKSPGEVWIRGKNFRKGLSVYFGGKQAKEVKVVAPNLLIAEVPPRSEMKRPTMVTVGVFYRSRIKDSIAISYESPDQMQFLYDPKLPESTVTPPKSVQ